MEEMKCLKLMDQVSLSEMNKFAGRNKDMNTLVASKYSVHWWSSPWIPGEDSMLLRTVTNRRRAHRRGGSDDMQTRIKSVKGETLLTAVRKDCKQGRSYNQSHGKMIEGERESDGVVVAVKLRNGSGAKYPCCKYFLQQNARQG